MREYLLDGRKMDSRQESHQYLQKTLGFPDHYGGNLDALMDCLREMRDTKITLRYSRAMLNSLGAYGRAMLQVFQDAQIEGNQFIFITKEQG
ncbi:MAG: barstar family protein [Christensenellales bacterium]|jgi:ribonuclease inhibitor|nr:barstar family protein [Clostridiales bacterium]